MSQPIVDFSQARRRNEAAQQREVRGEEADIGQTEASTAASRASARRTETLLPSESRRSAAEAAVAEQTAPSQMRREAAEADLAELRVRERRAILDRLESRRGDPDETRGKAQSVVLADIDRLRRARQLVQDRALATGFGSETLSSIGGTSAAQLNELLQPIRANNAFTALSDMRQASPTGGALGSIAVPELQLLMATEGSFSLLQNDEQMLRQLDDAIAARVRVAQSLNTPVEMVAEKLGPELYDQFAADIRSWRPNRSDEETLLNYANQSRADGTFDPSTFAYLMAEAYENATGNPADETFVDGVLTEAQNLAQTADPITAFDYSPADAAVREQGAGLSRAEGQRSLSASDVLGGVAGNLLPSTWNLASDTVQALTVDLPDTIDGIVDVVAGATGLSDDDTAWQGLKQHYINRYGSAEGFKQALMTDPAGVAADVAGIATLGGTTTARLATTASRSAQAAGRTGAATALARAGQMGERVAAAGAAVDPLAWAQRGAGWAATTAAPAVARNAVMRPVAAAAGVDAPIVERAFGAGTRNSPEFQQYFEGRGDPSALVAQAENALGEMYANRSVQYQDARNRLDLNETVPFADIDRALLDTESVGRYRDIDYRRAPQAWQAAKDIIENFRARGYDSVEAVDAMKQQLGALRDTYPVGSAERAVVQDIYNGVRGAITQAAPEYANMMRDYASTSDMIADLRASTSLDARSLDTALGRLARSASGRGPRGSSTLDMLEQTYSGRGLGDAVAGQVLSGAEPSRTTPLLSGGASMALGDPTPMAATMLSPGAVGRTAFGAGRAYGAVRDAAGAVADAAPIRFGRQALADLAQRYDTAVGSQGAGARDARAALTVANPALIQPLVNPQEAVYAPQNGEAEAYMVDAENAPPAVPAFRTQPAGTPSLGEIAQRYGVNAETPSGLSEMAQRYNGAPAAGQTVGSGTPPENGEVREIAGRIAVYDQTSGAWHDVDTGEPLPGQPYKKGGRVKPKRYARGGSVVPTPVFAR